MSRSLMAVVLLGACGGGGPKVPLTDLTVSECLNPVGSDIPAPDENLLLTARDQAIIVAHRAHALQCGHDVQVEARMDEREGRITVTYEDKAKDTTNCGCVYDLAYTLNELDAGTWVVATPGPQQAEITLE